MQQGFSSRCQKGLYKVSEVEFSEERQTRNRYPRFTSPCANPQDRVPELGRTFARIFLLYQKYTTSCPFDWRLR